MITIDFQNVVVDRYSVRALAGITYTFDSTRTPSVALLGANGAGKSTLLGAVLGLNPITSGKILVNEREANKRNFSAIRKQIGMIFQNSDDQLFSQTVEEDVAFGPNNLQLSAEEIQSRVASALERMGIASLAGRDINRLSGGEKRRVALAGVLAMRPEAIFLDEPTSMLDPCGCRGLVNYLNSLSALKLMATHDLAFARQVCGWAVLLKQGKIRADGPIDSILEDLSLLDECGLL